MKWENLLSPIRLGCDTTPEWSEPSRNEYQRDFDRIAFSHAFRRLQGKTQVFPMPANDLVHNRLTHSVESASVGRFLGGIVASAIGQDVELFSSVVGAACLAHDIGNPPFGHSGESAIAGFFQHEEGAKFMERLTAEESADFTKFEGNAMALRMLCHRKPVKTQVLGGERLTYTTLAAFVKYPRIAALRTVDTSLASQKKVGIFRSELSSFQRIAAALSLKDHGTDECCWVRHPLAFLVEAADDIAYKVADAEDGLKMHYVSKGVLSDVFHNIASAHFDKKDLNTGLNRITDKVEKVGFLRAKAMNSLIYQAADVFKNNESAILDGTFDEPLLKKTSSSDDIKRLSDITADRIYTAAPVVQIEAAGYEVLPGLLKMFLQAVLDRRGTGWGGKIAQCIPNEYREVSSHAEIGVSYTYEQIMSVAEFVCAMTDRYAINLFRTLRGISLPRYDM